MKARVFLVSFAILSVVTLLCVFSRSSLSVGISPARLLPETEESSVFGLRVGLQNGASVCYQNAILQNLVRSRVVREWAETVGASSGPVGAALKDLIDLFDTKTSGSISAMGFRQALAAGSGSPQWLRGAEDAPEFLTALFQELGPSFTLLVQVKLGKVCSCPCGDVHPLPDDVTETLIVPLLNTEAAELASLIHSLTNPDEVCRLCEVCDVNGSQNQTVIFRAPLPPLLVVQISRFKTVFSKGTPQRVKNSAPVKLPDQLVLSAQGEAGEEISEYDLLGMAEHTGGHYVAHVREPGNSKWMFYDDATARNGQGSDQPYIAFYQMRT